MKLGTICAICAAFVLAQLAGTYCAMGYKQPQNTERQLEIFAACIADVPKESPRFADAIGECLIASRELAR